MKKRLLISLRQQLIHEVFFVSNVGKPYRDEEEDLDIIDFQYKNKPHKLVLNGDLRLKFEDRQIEVGSYESLVQGLLKINR